MKNKRKKNRRWGKIRALALEVEGMGGMIKAFNLPAYSLIDQVIREIAGQGTPGYPRPGGYETVDPAAYPLAGLDFSTSHGPAMRMVVELEEGVMRAYNVIPGGTSDLQPRANLLTPVKVDSESHYGDQLPLWLANQYRPQYIYWEDVTHVVNQAGPARISFHP